MNDYYEKSLIPRVYFRYCLCYELICRNPFELRVWSCNCQVA